jgi:outer membrane protein assembly factor BamD
MSRRILIFLLTAVLVLATACINKKVTNPIANVDSKQPDKILFDRAMEAMKHNRYDVARLTMQTLINTYPDSEFVARAKLAIADSWYAEGGSASLEQAESQYKDFITFFPNMPEAAEAQLKIANIQYQQMEKPDRDFTHAVRAEEEYRQLIQQFPDSKLVPQAKQRLREVQEVIAEREYRVAHFYYMRQAYPAAIARLRSLADKYPLYSKADEVLYLLGRSYEGEIDMIRARPNCVSPGNPRGCIDEATKARMIAPWTKGAADAYSRVLTRYPVMDRADDAKARLLALREPVPRPTKAEIAQNKAEEDSRKSSNMLSRFTRNFEKRPDTTDAARVGEPTLVDPTPVSASDIVQQAARSAAGVPTSSDNNSVSVETVNGTPGANAPAPRSDAAAPSTDATPATAPANAAAPADPNELKPNVGTSDANELNPNVPADQGQGQATLPPPQQVNQIQGPAGNGQATSNASQTGSANSADSQSSDDSNAEASSKHKKKKGIHKILPF